MTVYDLEEVELAYAPQYGSAKDPINMAGFVAAGLLRGDHPQVDVETVIAAAKNERPFLLDVRTPREFNTGHIPGAVNIEVDELRSRLGESLAIDRRLLSGRPAGVLGNTDPATNGLPSIKPWRRLHDLQALLPVGVTVACSLKHRDVDALDSVCQSARFFSGINNRCGRCEVSLSGRHSGCFVARGIEQEHQE
jgi:hypothetical protein